jgi:hypothetical protein
MVNGFLLGPFMVGMYLGSVITALAIRVGYHFWEKHYGDEYALWKAHELTKNNADEMMDQLGWYEVYDRKNGIAMDRAAWLKNSLEYGWHADELLPYTDEYRFEIREV